MSRLRHVAGADRIDTQLLAELPQPRQGAIQRDGLGGHALTVPAITPMRGNDHVYWSARLPRCRRASRGHVCGGRESALPPGEVELLSGERECGAGARLRHGRPATSRAASVDQCQRDCERNHDRANPGDGVHLAAEQPACGQARS